MVGSNEPQGVLKTRLIGTSSRGLCKQLEQLAYCFQLPEATVLKGYGYGQNEAALAASQAHLLGHRVSRRSFCFSSTKVRAHPH